MSNRFRIALAGCWAIAIMVAAVLDATPGFASLLPVIAVVTLCPDRNRCVRTAMR